MTRIWSGEPDGFTELYAWAGGECVMEILPEKDGGEYVVKGWNPEIGWYRLEPGDTVEVRESPDKTVRGLYAIARKKTDEELEAELLAEEANQHVTVVENKVVQVETKPAVPVKKAVAPPASPAPKD